MKHLTLDGLTLSIPQWSLEMGISTDLIAWRVKQGWSIEDVLRPSRKYARHMLTHDGKTHSLRTWSQLLGVRYDLLRKRLDAGWSVEHTLTFPASERHARSARVRVQRRAA